MQRHEFEGACLISLVAKHNLHRSGRCISPAAFANEEHVQICSATNVITVNSELSLIRNRTCALARELQMRELYIREVWLSSEFFVSIFLLRNHRISDSNQRICREQFDEKKRVSLSYIFSFIHLIVLAIPFPLYI